MKELLETYQNVKECVYKNERYSIRDNGAVLRHSIEGKRARPTDNKWTFGKLNGKNGFLEIASVRVHSIVATAFHGEAPTKNHVVNHIDRNKENNRTDNLRWVTRLESSLLDLSTASKIAYICGSVEEFLENPSFYRDRFLNPDFIWMTNISIEEAKASKERLFAWIESDPLLNGGTLGAWMIYKMRTKEDLEFIEEEIEYIDSLTLNAIQIASNWKTPTEFPCCPQVFNDDSLREYKSNLNTGEVFSKNQNTTAIIERFEISNDGQVLWIMCRSAEEDAIKPYSLAEITFQNNSFLHKVLGTFFEKRGAEKQYTLEQGLEWTGEDGVDDYC